MDLKVCIFCLVVYTAYLYHCILVLHDKLEYKSYTIDTVKRIQDAIIREEEQQKFKLDELRTKIVNIKYDNLEFRQKIERTILQMQAENMKDFKDLLTRLQSDHDGVKDELEEIKKNLKETFGKTFEEIEEAYIVSKNILERINKLEVNENRRQDTGVLWMIKQGISRLAQLAWNFFLGQKTGYLE
ncbi:uncharacterized protein LOC127718389 [Mytilus californianus]|uniref:uncharacterized protein LOC127718389 n=1 Tax=Mytilus californianus TaxID=6549 RepID=UPI002247DCC8|nr:uncharacterized protein LOC127718389 [Mytilus californianus]